MKKQIFTDYVLICFLLISLGKIFCVLDGDGFPTRNEHKNQPNFQTLNDFNQQESIDYPETNSRPKTDTKEPHETGQGRLNNNNDLYRTDEQPQETEQQQYEVGTSDNDFSQQSSDQEPTRKEYSSGKQVSVHEKRDNPNIYDYEMYTTPDYDYEFDESGSDNKSNDYIDNISNDSTLTNEPTSTNNYLITHQQTTEQTETTAMSFSAMNKSNIQLDIANEKNFEQDNFIEKKLLETRAPQNIYATSNKEFLRTPDPIDQDPLQYLNEIKSDKQDERLFKDIDNLERFIDNENNDSFTQTYLQNTTTFYTGFNITLEDSEHHSFITTPGYVSNTTLIATLYPNVTQSKQIRHKKHIENKNKRNLPNSRSQSKDRQTKIRKKIVERLKKELNTIKKRVLSLHDKVVVLKKENLDLNKSNARFKKEKQLYQNRLRNTWLRLKIMRKELRHYRRLSRERNKSKNGVLSNVDNKTINNQLSNAFPQSVVDKVAKLVNFENKLNISKLLATNKNIKGSLFRLLKRLNKTIDEVEYRRTTNRSAEKSLNGVGFNSIELTTKVVSDEDADSEDEVSADAYSYNSDVNLDDDDNYDDYPVVTVSIEKPEKIYMTTDESVVATTTKPVTTVQIGGENQSQRTTVSLALGIGASIVGLILVLTLGALVYHVVQICLARSRINRGVDSSRNVNYDPIHNGYNETADSSQINLVHKRSGSVQRILNLNRIQSDPSNSQHRRNL